VYNLEPAAPAGAYIDGYRTSRQGTGRHLAVAVSGNTDWRYDKILVSDIVDCGIAVAARELRLIIMRKFIGAIIASVVFAGPALADGLVDGDADAGKAKSVTCAACHGADGNSVNPVWPSIAGQHATYIVQQLHAFKDGKRTEPLMLGQVMMLSDDDMKNLAVYFSEMPKAPKAVSDPSVIDRGERLYRGGNRDNATSACIACHGPTGSGNPAAGVPSVRGQYAAYAATQLRNFANGSRTSDGPTRVMRDIAGKLSEDDIVAVTSYMQGLQ
jgi:cytochrome c553